MRNTLPLQDHLGINVVVEWHPPGLDNQLLGQIAHAAYPSGHLAIWRPITLRRPNRRAHSRRRRGMVELVPAHSPCAERYRAAEDFRAVLAPSNLASRRNAREQRYADAQQADGVMRTQGELEKRFVAVTVPKVRH
jgi:hypothetical protein